MHVMLRWAQRVRAARSLLAALLMAAPLAAWAQYPEQAIRVFVAFPAGSAVDVVARSIVSTWPVPWDSRW